MADISIGRRVRLYRDAEGLGQKALATRAGISLDHLSAIERGVRSPSITVLDRLAAALSVPVPALVGELVADGDSLPGPPALAAVNRAMLISSVVDGDEDATDLADLEERVRDAYRRWNLSPRLVTELGDALPGLVRGAEAAVNSRKAPGEATERQAAQRARASVYWLVRSFCRQLKRIELCVLAADRGLHAAESTNDHVAAAVARYNVSHALLVANEPEAAEEVATKSAAALKPRLGEDLAAIGIYGQLHLVAAVAAQRSGDYNAACQYLREAEPAARRTGELNPYWTNFGPSNVAIHWVSIETVAGRTEEALHRAEDVHLPSVTSLNRRSTYYLDLARCYADRGDDAAAAYHLLQAERMAPEFLKYGALARDLLRVLTRSARTSYAADMRALAERMGVK